MIIDLRSDTVTKPSSAMLEVMMSAKVGDDVFGEDPTVNALEKKAAALFGKEAALFCPSGTMTNQVAIKVHTQPGDEVICSDLSHIYNYEGGGIAFNSACSIKTIKGERGRFKVADVEQAINPCDVHFALTKLVSIENTCNKGGGSTWDIKEIENISSFCKKKNLKFHLDGARLFNAFAAKAKHRNTKTEGLKTGRLFDSISICLSKGLGAPAGSVLIGDQNFISRARRVRKVFGGAMRQAGYIAAAGIFALDNNIGRLKEDHERARVIEKALLDLPYITNIYPVETNIIIFELDQKITTETFIRKLEAKNIKVISMGPRLVRMVTHLDFTDEMLGRLVKVLTGM